MHVVKTSQEFNYTGFAECWEAKICGLLDVKWHYFLIYTVRINWIVEYVQEQVLRGHGDLVHQILISLFSHPDSESPVLEISRWDVDENVVYEVTLTIDS